MIPPENLINQAARPKPDAPLVLAVRRAAAHLERQLAFYRIYYP